MKLGMIERQELYLMKTSIVCLQYLGSNPTAYGERLRVCVANSNLLFGYNNYTENFLVTESCNADSLQNCEILKLKVLVKYYWL
jgi:hypothetical protein